MRNGCRLVGFAIHLILIVCFISKERLATLITPFSVCYYLELHNAIISYSRVQFLLAISQKVVRTLYAINNFSW